MKLSKGIHIKIIETIIRLVWLSERSIVYLVYKIINYKIGGKVRDFSSLVTLSTNCVVLWQFIGARKSQIELVIFFWKYKYLAPEWTFYSFLELTWVLKFKYEHIDKNTQTERKNNYWKWRWTFLNTKSQKQKKNNICEWIQHSTTLIALVFSFMFSTFYEIAAAKFVQMNYWKYNR